MPPIGSAGAWSDTESNSAKSSGVTVSQSVTRALSSVSSASPASSACVTRLFPQTTAVRSISSR